jgi:hypothetical protein
MPDVEWPPQLDHYCMTSFGPTKITAPASADLTIRQARPSDTHALFRLAQLDSTRAPRGRVLVAVVGGELWAAVSMDDLHAVADPFRPTREIVMLLALRATQLRQAALPPAEAARVVAHPALAAHR